MMTKKNYIAAAKITNALYVRAKVISREVNAFAQANAALMTASAEAVQGAFILLFMEDNPRFDSARFIEACQKVPE